MSTNAAHANKHERRRIRTSTNNAMHEQAGTSRESKNEREELVAQTSGDRRGRGQSRTNKWGRARTSGKSMNECGWCGCATFGISHLGPSSHILYLDRISHSLFSTCNHNTPVFPLFPPLEIPQTLSMQIWVLVLGAVSTDHIFILLI